MKVEQTVREFKYGTLILKDPNPAQSPEEVKTFYALTYPELTNAGIEEPDREGNKITYEFRKAVGRKGAAADRRDEYLNQAVTLLTEAALGDDGVDGEAALDLVDRIGKTLPLEGKSTDWHRLVEMYDRLCAAAGVDNGDEIDILPVIEALLNGGAGMVAQERRRQISTEGYDVTHDDRHADGSLAMAGACYAEFAGNFARYEELMARNGRQYEDVVRNSQLPWPWDLVHRKPKDQLRDLVRAGALITAEIDRLLRAKAKRGED